MTDPQFAAQVDAELQRVTAKIERLQSLKTKLQDLKHDLAQTVQEAPSPLVAPSAPVPTEPAQPHVPQARRANASTAKAEPEKPEPAQVKAKPAKPAKAKSVKAKPAKTTAAKTPPAKRARTTKKTTKAPRARHSRTDRIFQLLDEQPRSAAEVTKLLEESYPDQKGPENTVRTALNSLVGQDRAHLSRQGSAVFYSRPAAAGEAGPAEPAKAAEDTVSADA
jgi:hypothetical protein